MRYRSDRRIRAGKCLATSDAVNKIRMAYRNNRIKCTVYTIKENERLDTLAARFLGDATLWWILSTANGIQGKMVLEPGTLIRIPGNISNIIQKFRNANG